MAPTTYHETRSAMIDQEQQTLSDLVGTCREIVQVTFDRCFPGLAITREEVSRRGSSLALAMAACFAEESDPYGAAHAHAIRMLAEEVGR